MKPSSSRGIVGLFHPAAAAALLVLAACAARKESPEAPQSASPTYGGDATAPAPTPPRSPESSTDAPPKQEAAPTKELQAIDESDPVRALADAEKLLDQTLPAKKGAPVRGEGGAPPAKEELGDSCSIACRALASMRRSADRVCQLAPSASPDAPRCDDAKERVGKAERRVQERCPTCAASP